MKLERCKAKTERAKVHHDSIGHMLGCTFGRQGAMHSDQAVCLIQRKVKAMLVNLAMANLSRQTVGGSVNTEVGSSRSRIEGLIKSSCPIDALLRSPPEIPFRKKPPEYQHE